MKKIFFSVITIIVFARCNNDRKVFTESVPTFNQYRVNYDSIIMAKDSIILSLMDQGGKNKGCDTVFLTNPVLQKKADSLLRRTITYDFTMKQLKRYCDIVGKNPTQIKFLRGWVLRAIDIR